MYLDLDALRAAPGKLFRLEGEEEIPALDWRGEEVQLEGPVHAEALAFFEGATHQVILTVHVQGRAHRRCSRCLAEIVEDFDREEELEVYPDEVQGKYLELRPFIEAGARLGLEAKPLCKPDCRGICAYCGVDLNREEHRADCQRPRLPRDPRLSKLAELLEQKG